MLRIFAIAATMLATGASAQRPAPLPADAPGVGCAHAWIEREKRIGQPLGEVLVNVTTTTTPELLHRPTGAICRFWYGTGSVDYPFHNDKHFACSTMRDWFAVGTSIDFRETPPAVAERPDTHWWGYLAKADADISEVLLRRVKRLMNPDTYGISHTQPIEHRWTGPDGRTIRYVTADALIQGGVPSGTRQQRLYRFAVIEAGRDWIVTHHVTAPIHYRASIETMHAEGLQRLLQAIGRPDAASIAAVQPSGCDRNSM